MASGSVKIYPVHTPANLPRYQGSTNLTSLVAYVISLLPNYLTFTTLCFRFDFEVGQTQNEVFGTSSGMCMCQFSSANYGYGILVSDNPNNFASFYVSGGTAHYEYGKTNSVVLSDSIITPNTGMSLWAGNSRGEIRYNRHFVNINALIYFKDVEANKVLGCSITVPSDLPVVSLYGGYCSRRIPSGQSTLVIGDVLTITKTASTTMQIVERNTLSQHGATDYAQAVVNITQYFV